MALSHWQNILLRVLFPKGKKFIMKEQSMSNFQNRGFFLLITLLIAIGGIVHLTPLVVGGEFMIKSISEDGYLMLTIARNMALGLGMSTAEGSIPTNGTQPLMTAIWAAGYWLVNGNKIQGIVWVMVMQFIIATLAAVLLWQGGKRILQQYTTAGTVAALAAATWYASLLTSMNTTNGLETGLYTLCVIGVAMMFSLTVHTWSIRRCIGLGVLLGITFWARNDAVFFIFAVCATHLLLGPFDFNNFKQRLWQVLVMGTISVVIALPWLINNQLKFGSIMPISGHSQSLNTSLAGNLPLIPATLVQNLLPFAPTPTALQKQIWVIVICTVIILAIGGLLIVLWSRFHTASRRLVMLVSIYTVGIASYYGLYFGAPQFVDRYLFPSSPFFTLLWAAIVIFVWQRLVLTKLRPIMPMFAVAFIGVIVASYVVAYQHLFAHMGIHHGHFKFTNWVEKNVPEDVWVGAGQSGMLGYFHDRTINLDGKVNPHALKARKKHELKEYIMRTDIQYIVDWYYPHLGSSAAMKPPASPNIELIIREIGLSVWRVHK